MTTHIDGPSEALRLLVFIFLAIAVSVILPGCTTPTQGWHRETVIRATGDTIVFRCHPQVGCTRTNLDP